MGSPRRMIVATPEDEIIDLRPRTRHLYAVHPEPRRQLCPHCLRPVIHAIVHGDLVIADVYEWEIRASCQSCLHTRRAHPGVHVSCSRCGDTGMVGTGRPAGQMLAIDVAWADELHLRVIGPRTDRRRGEALHPLHVCQADY